MRRFRLLFTALCLALLAAIGLLVERALHSVALERQLRHQTVAERVFDEMERALSQVLAGEEARPFEAYTYGAAARPAPPFVVGHFLLDPDGQLHALPAAGREPGAAAAEIERGAGAYWRADRAASAMPTAKQLPGTTVPVTKLEAAPAVGAAREPAAAADDLSAFDALRALNKGAADRVARQRTLSDEYDAREGVSSPRAYAAAPAFAGAKQSAAEGRDARADGSGSELDFMPMSGRVVDAGHVLLHRTAVRHRQAFRQGALLELEPLGEWLRAQALGDDGLGDYARVAFATPFSAPPAAPADAALVFQHRFAEPFDDLTARLALQPLPGGWSVGYVYAVCVLLVASAGLGLAALYRMVAVIVGFAERRGDFVAAVTHELKTPLTAIRMYGEMLRDGLVASEAKRAEYYRHITAESERLSRLIDNVLEHARLEKGTREVALTLAPLAPAVQAAAELLRPHVEAAGGTLRVEADADLPPVRFERDALMQVLGNLIDNAVKYAGDAADREIALRCRGDAHAVRVAVRDRGPGVAPAHLSRIFEPFYRGERELTRRHRGTGLGLALVRGLAERMGAQIEARNLPGGGFEVELAFRAGG